ncbi:YwiC-like family protein [Trichothermofontia sichuanensis B231]|uniref:YwiC-like family protein n=1 Tax=Trichothermofontia sichuanensis TaxID=3045816 RepID=UPI00224753D3|nr:YwiC-like family protein [Trichothermofontia sichuanensis]UZQ54223.1 YwiC-like family protein [Trichothermofontia sichuanensis B231]
MALSDANPPVQNGDVLPSDRRAYRAPAWYHPTVSPEHGVYIVLLVSFLSGAAAAQQWTLATTLAGICALAGFQAEHPLVLQIKQRRTWKPRLLLWGSLYGGLALGLALYLYLQVPVLIWLYLGAIAALLIDAISVFYRQQRSIGNELLTFAAVCLAAPFAAIATTKTITFAFWGLWLLNTLFFSSAIFTVKLRKPKTQALMPGLVYHSVATLIVCGLWYGGGLTTLAAIAFGIALIKFGLILWQLEWYKTTAIHQVAILETLSAMVFFLLTAISLLPNHPVTAA